MSKVKFIYQEISRINFKLYCFRETVSFITSIGGEVSTSYIIKNVIHL
jgi:hypothetical protein